MSSLGGQAALSAQAAEAPYDAFVSYRTSDIDEVRKVVGALRGFGLHPWFDEDELPPGAYPTDELTKAIRDCRIVLAFIGKDDAGVWQRQELRFAQQRLVEEKCRIIPVLLPGAPRPSSDTLPGFLVANSFVIFQQSVAETDQLNRIYWGVTGRKRSEPAAATERPPDAPRAADDAVEAAIAGLVERLEMNKITFCVGSGAWQSGAALAPRACEIARQFLLKIDVAEARDAVLLPPIDVAASYYGIGKGDDRLEYDYKLLLRAQDLVPVTHQSLAAAVRRIHARPRPRGSLPSKQLIVTTNLDTMMERALLREGVGFTRLVQHTARPELYLSQYHEFVRQDQQAASPLLPHAGPNDLDRAIAETGALRSPSGKDYFRPDEIQSSHLVEPVLFKFRGSLDVPYSSAISTAQIFSFARAVIAGQWVPRQITEILGATPIVFLGAGYLDADFRLLDYTLLNDAWDSVHPKYMVQARPEADQDDCYRRMERGPIWTQIKARAGAKHISMLELNADSFLARFLEHL